MIIKDERSVKPDSAAYLGRRFALILRHGRTMVVFPKQLKQQKQRRRQHELIWSSCTPIDDALGLPAASKQDIVQSHFGIAVLKCGRFELIRMELLMEDVVS